MAAKTLGELQRLEKEEEEDLNNFRFDQLLLIFSIRFSF